MRRAEFKKDQVAIFEFLINDIFFRQLTLLVFLHSDVKSAELVEAIEVFRIACLHLIANHDLKVAKSVAEFDLEHDVLRRVGDQSGYESQPLLATLVTLVKRHTRGIAGGIHDCLDQLLLIVIAIAKFNAGVRVNAAAV